MNLGSFGTECKKILRSFLLPWFPLHWFCVNINQGFQRGDHTFYSPRQGVVVIMRQRDRRPYFQQIFTTSQAGPSMTEVMKVGKGGGPCVVCSSANNGPEAQFVVRCSICHGWSCKNCTNVVEGVTACSLCQTLCDFCPGRVLERNGPRYACCHARVCEACAASPEQQQIHPHRCIISCAFCDSMPGWSSHSFKQGSIHYACCDTDVCAQCIKNGYDHPHECFVRCDCGSYVKKSMMLRDRALCEREGIDSSNRCVHNQYWELSLDGKSRLYTGSGLVMCLEEKSD